MNIINVAAYEVYLDGVDECVILTSRIVLGDFDALFRVWGSTVYHHTYGDSARENILKRLVAGSSAFQSGGQSVHVCSGKNNLSLITHEPASLPNTRYRGDE